MNIEKIKYKNKIYFVDGDDLNDNSIKKIFLFEDENLQHVAKTALGKTLITNKSNLIDSLNEFGGAGFAYGGGNMLGRSRSGVNRGGFGGGGGLGGTNMMYTYEIKPLNTVLQPNQLGSPDVEEIKLGNDISGMELNKRDDKLHVGSLIKIEKSADGALKYYVILNPDTAQPMKIDPTSANLISKTDGINPIADKLSKEEEELMKPGFMRENVNTKILVKENINNYLEK